MRCTFGRRSSRSTKRCNIAVHTCVAHSCASMGRIRPLPPLIPDSAMSPGALKLKKFHDDFITQHSSPMREKFVYEFGRDCKGPPSWMPTPSATKEQLPSPSLSAKPRPDQRFESTNQCHYMCTPISLIPPTHLPCPACLFPTRATPSLPLCLATR